MARRRMLAPINSIKHFVPRTNTSQAIGSVVNLVIADAVSAPASTNTFDVIEGAIIKAVRCEMWIAQGLASGTLTQAVVIVEKVPANQNGATVTNLLNLQAYDNKKNILYTFQGMIGSVESGNQPIPSIREWVLIPKGKQRFGRGDRLIMSITTVSQIMNTCGMFIYKEYR